MRGFREVPFRGAAWAFPQVLLLVACSGSESTAVQAPEPIAAVAPLKLVHAPEEGDQLFDLAADPHELTALSQARPETVVRMRRALVETRDRQSARYRAGAPVGGLSKEVVEGLEALGYVEP